MNCQDFKGNTPLHLACECNNIGMVDFLVKSGAKKKVENKALQIPGDLASRPVIRDILGWKPGGRGARGSLSSSSHTSTSDPGAAGREKSEDIFRKPPPLENKFLTRVKSSNEAVASPESFQDRMKRLTREKRRSMSKKATLVQKSDTADDPIARRGSKSKAAFSWNKKFLKKYGLNTKNLFAP